jgi:hypothetical protein
MGFGLKETHFPQSKIYNDHSDMFKYLKPKAQRCKNIQNKLEVKCFTSTFNKCLPSLFGFNAMSLDSKDNPY